MYHSITELIKNITNQLTEHYKSERIASVNAWNLLEHLTKKNKTYYIAHPKETLSIEQYEQLEIWVSQIIRDKKPIQYIIGTVPFLDLTIHIEKPILIPRPETEEWCNKLITQLKKNSLEPKNILDLCTGSGCIALAFAHAFPNSTVHATDISQQALALAKKNALANDITNTLFYESDVYSNIRENAKFDLIISNPPYITEQEYNELEPTVIDWEDPRALTTEDNGLKIIKKIIADAPRFLRYWNKEVPQVWIEMGHKQADHVAQIFKNSGLIPAVIKDLYGNDRVVTGKLENLNEKHT